MLPCIVTKQNVTGNITGQHSHAALHLHDNGSIVESMLSLCKGYLYLNLKLNLLCQVQNFNYSDSKFEI